MKTFLNEFKEFINRGNVMDLAVGVIIGGAFTSIVTALTDHIINPLIAVVAGGGTDSISGLVIPGTDIDFGAFISAIINFLIVAFVVFLLVKGIKRQDTEEGQRGNRGGRASHLPVLQGRGEGGRHALPALRCGAAAGGRAH